MIFYGYLRVVSEESFLDEHSGKRSLLIMRDVPAGGTPQQRLAAATEYFVRVRKFAPGEWLAVDGEKVPLGTGYQTAILVDR